MKSNDHANELSLAGLVAVLLRGWYYIVGACLVTGAGAWLFSRLMLPRVYVSQASVVYESVEGSPSQELAALARLAGRTTGDTGYLLKQVVRSRSAAEAVAEGLELAERWNLGSARSAAALVQQGLTASLETGNLLRLEMALSSTPRGWGPRVSDDPQAQLTAEIILELLQYAKEYLQQNRYQTGRRLRIFLDEQLVRAESDLNDARDRLVAFENRTGIIMPTEQYSELHRTLASLDQNVRSLQVELVRINTLLQLARVAENPDWNPEPGEIPKEAVLPTTSATLTPLRSQLLEQTRALVHARQIEGKSQHHPDVLAITATIAELRKQIAAELDVEQDSLTVESIVKQTELGAYQAERREAAGRLAQAPETSSVHADLAAEAELQRQLFAELYRQRQQALIQEERESVVFDVLDAPLVPTAPSKPATMLNTLAGMFFGLFVGAFIALYRHPLRPSRTSTTLLEG